MVLAAKPKRHAGIQHKKRSGQHHKQGKHYASPYWPYLPLLLIVGLGLVFNGVWSGRAHGVLGDATSMSATELLADTNVQRTDDHEAALNLNSRLTGAAQAKANDMVARNYWSHNTPDGKTPWTFITAAHYNYQAAGENLAYGFQNSGSVINGWMNSVEHRANILDKNYQDVGFGIVNSPNYQNSGPETLVVAMYAEPGGTMTSAVSTSGSGSTVSFAATHSAAAVPQPTPAAVRVARVQDLPAGNAAWSLFIVSTLGAVALMWFALRHALAWKRVVVHSEEFIIRHRFLDILIVSVATLGFILTRTAGMIH
ncbi:MAG TPA: CAP domain-containing protein [Candidatus Saccharimonadales bacterium]|jgi:hypothetical protein